MKFNTFAWSPNQSTIDILWFHSLPTTKFLDSFEEMKTPDSVEYEDDDQTIEGPSHGRDSVNQGNHCEFQFTVNKQEATHPDDPQGFQEQDRVYDGGSVVFMFLDQK